MPEYDLVAQPDTLAAALKKCVRIGVDTEFMREKTYFPELCLVQVATPERIHCVDPLSAIDMEAFWAALLDTPWVLHSGRQDIEVVLQSAGRMPAAVFDTQIAAGLLGHAPQMGYATLVKTLFGIELDKSHTRADWSRRPLREAFLRYAAEDVEYLLSAYDILTQALCEKGRLAWAEEDSAQLLDPALYVTDPRAAVGRLKGAAYLRGRRRAVATGLADWREREAIRANRPRQWVARDAALIEIATRLPADTNQLGEIDSLPAGLVRRAGGKILAVVAAADHDDTGYTPPRGPSDAQKSLLKSMQRRVKERANDLGLATETLASKRDLTAVINAGDQHSRLHTGWRHEVIGRELLALL
jgi:ribonuclease D